MVEEYGGGGKTFKRMFLALSEPKVFVAHLVLVDVKG